MNTFLLNLNSSTEINGAIHTLKVMNIYMCVAVCGLSSVTSSNQKPRPFQVLAELIPEFSLLLAKLSALREHGSFPRSGESQVLRKVFSGVNQPAGISWSSQGAECEEEALSWLTCQIQLVGMRKSLPLLRILNYKPSLELGHKDEVPLGIWSRGNHIFSNTNFLIIAQAWKWGQEGKKGTQNKQK